MSSNYSFSMEELIYFKSSKDQSLSVRLDYRVKCTQNVSSQKNPKSCERNITTKLIRFLEELPTVMLKLVFSFLFFLSKMPCGLADFQINMTVVGKISPAFHSVLQDTLNLFKMLLYLKHFFKKLVNRY